MGTRQSCGRSRVLVQAKKINLGESASFAMTTVLGETFKASRIRTINRRSCLFHLLCHGLVGDVKEPTSKRVGNSPGVVVWPVRVGALHGFRKPLCTFPLGHSCPRKIAINKSVYL